MEIINRAKGDSDGEVVAFNEDTREEALRRSAKAGYCTRSGENPNATKIQVSNPFGAEKLNVWPRDENGHLID